MTNGGGTGHHEQAPKKSAKKAKGSSKSKKWTPEKLKPAAKAGTSSRRAT